MKTPFNAIAATTNTRARGGPNGVMAQRPSDIDDPDFYPTPPCGGRAIGEILAGLDPHARSCWEPACGAYHLAHGLKDYFPTLYCSDAYLYDGNPIYDFYSAEPTPYVADWIVTNPPFTDLIRFILLAYARARRGAAMLMRLSVLEGQERHALLYGDAPLTHLFPFSERLPIHRGRWEEDGSSATAYAWFVFSKRHAADALAHGWRGIDIPPGTWDRLTRPSDAAFACGD